MRNMFPRDATQVVSGIEIGLDECETGWTLEVCPKVTSTDSTALPATAAPAPYSLSQLCVLLCLSCVVVVVFLLWAEFYTVCQSPERHTLEGPVE